MQDIKHGFTQVDNRIYFVQEVVSSSAFSVFMRIHRMTVGYNKPSAPLSNSFLQKNCNMSKNTVTKAIKDLEEANLIYTRRVSRSATLFQINMNTVNRVYEDIMAKEEAKLDLSIDLSQTEHSQQDTQYDSHSITPEPQIKALEDNVGNTTTNDNCNEFEAFWLMYGKNVGKELSQKVWNSLTQSEKEAIMLSLPKYVESTPDKVYRKNPLTYLNGKHWEDEIVDRKTNSTKNTPNTQTNVAGNYYENTRHSYEERMQQQFNEIFS